MFKEKATKEDLMTIIDDTNSALQTRDTRIVDLQEKVDLILEHLDLRYVPAKEEKTPAKLEERVPTISELINADLMGSLGEYQISGGGGDPTPTPKRKYTHRCPVKGCDFTSKVKKGVSIHKGQMHK